MSAYSRVGQLMHIIGAPDSDNGHVDMIAPCVELPAVALPVIAPGPAAGPALAFLQLLLGPPNAALSGGLLLCVLHPADELVASQGCDVLPGIERRGIGDQRLTQVRGQFVHHPTGHSLAAHGARVMSRVAALSGRPHESAARR